MKPHLTNLLRSYRAFLLFAAVGGFGTILNTLILYVLAQRLGMYYLGAAAIATELAIMSNFLGNNFITFKHKQVKQTLWQRFLAFQLISLVSLAGTITLLWIFVSLFGETYLLVWNALAIVVMFFANYALNAAITWREHPHAKHEHTESHHLSNNDDKVRNDAETPKGTEARSDADASSSKHASLVKNDRHLQNTNGKRMLFLLFAVFASIFAGISLVPSTHAANTSSAAQAAANPVVVAISQLGYHPLSYKQVVVYTTASSGTFNLINAANGATEATGTLQKALNFAGSPVECQGGVSCLIGDFTNVTSSGSYYITTSGAQSATFPINSNVFGSTVPLFLEFFNAEMQQGSQYHADMHSTNIPAFTLMADGSFIMEADQAALPLIRLGSAYRRNPALFQSDSNVVLAAGKPDMQEYIVAYVDYLESLQGVQVTQSNSALDARLGTGMLINNAFVPGPTNLTTLAVYIPNSPPTLLQNTPVVSLCGANDNTTAWSTCIANAALYDKCQIDEPCLNISYNDRHGTMRSNAIANNYAVSKGWSYEFGCYFDVDMNNGNFNAGQVNPCQIFYSNTNSTYTTMTLLAFLEAYPAVKDYSAVHGQELLLRSTNTYDYVQTTYGTFRAGDPQASFVGAAAFLLYDYSNDTTYLQDAYAARTLVPTVFISDNTRGNEFYWEEYVRHAGALANSNLQYTYAGQNPEEFFRGKIYNDYKDMGPTSIGENGERVFEFDPNVLFMNSRFMLIEALLAQKTTELAPTPEAFIAQASQNQLAWLTGLNLVEQGTGLHSTKKSMSFIFGIGNFPTQFHSRWLVDTGYSSASSGAVIGTRGSGYQFFDATNNSFVYLDSSSAILNSLLGSNGNSYHNETRSNPFVIGRSFRNGKTYIPGWINGAFLAPDGNQVFNYNDNLNNYEYTETTNELVAAAIEYVAYLDGDLNNRSRYIIGPVFAPPNQTNNTNSTNSTNSTNNTSSNFTQLTIVSNPGFVNFTLGNFSFDNTTFTNFTASNSVSIITTANGTASLYNFLPGNYSFSASKVNYTTLANELILFAQNNTISITLQPVGTNNNTNSTNNTNNTQNNSNSTQNNTNSTNNTGNSTNNATNSTNNTNATGAQILSAGTSLAPLSNINGTLTYFLYENNTAQFWINSSANNTLLWYVDGIAQTTTTSQQAQFSWTPGVLWVPRAPDYANEATSTIIASSANESRTWLVSVSNIINPFFSSVTDSAETFGSDDVKIHVFASNATTYTDVAVILTSSAGMTTYTLSKQFSNAIETDWSTYIPVVTYGNNFLSTVIARDNVTNTSTTFDLGTSRAHYRTPPPSTSGGNSGGSGGSSSGGSYNYNSYGGGYGTPQQPQVIYLTLEHDVLFANQSQSVTLDAKYYDASITGVTVQFRKPDNTTQNLPLELINGTNNYGTWSAAMNKLQPGKYTVVFVTLTTDDGADPTELPIANRSFYFSESSTANGKLGLIYTLLNPSSLALGQNATLTVDAADPGGVNSILATFTDAKSGQIIVPLHRVSGTALYGTWVGTFTPTHSDTTYSLVNITVASRTNNQTYLVSDRSVYVQSEPNQGGTGTTGITGAATSSYGFSSMSDIIKRPLVPTLLGFTLLALLAGVQLFVRRARAK